MPTAPKPPEQRRRRNKEQPKRAVSVALPAESKRKAPPPPAWLPKNLHADYRAVWRSSVAHLWPPSADELVARLVQLRKHVRAIDPETVRPAHFSIVLQLERELLLAPRAARASGVTVRDEADVLVGVDVDDDDQGDDEPAAPARGSRSSRRAIDADRRKRILRAVK